MKRPNQDEDFQEEEEQSIHPKRKRARKKNVIQLSQEPLSYSQRDANFEITHGSPNDSKEMDARMSSYTPEEWEQFATSILTKSVDSQTSTEELHVYFNVFYKLFCCNMKEERDVSVRLKAIYPNVRTMNEQFKTVSERFGRLHLEYENRNLVSQ